MTIHRQISHHIRVPLHYYFIIAHLYYCSVVSTTERCNHSVMDSDDVPHEWDADGWYLYRMSRVQSPTPPSEALRIRVLAADSDANSLVRDAFRRAWHVQQILLPPTLTCIQDRAFAHCRSLVHIVLPDAVHTLGVGVFQHCHALESIRLSANLAHIPAGCFLYCVSLTEIDWPCSSEQQQPTTSTFSSIGPAAFQACTSLAHVTLPQSLQVIGDQAFDGCAALTSLELPPNLHKIGHCAFQYCHNLQHVQFPKRSSSLTSIGQHAFDGCSALQEVSLSLKLLPAVKFHNKSTDFFVGRFAFASCESLERVSISILLENNKTSTSTAATTAEQSTLGGAGEELTTRTSSVKVGYGAFQECTALSYCKISGADSLCIEGHAMEGCPNLKQVDMHDTTRLSVGDKAFAECSALESLHLPKCTRLQMDASALTECYSFQSLQMKPLDNLNLWPRVLARHGNLVTRGLVEEDDDHSLTKHQSAQQYQTTRILQCLRQNTHLLAELTAAPRGANPRKRKRARSLSSFWPLLVPFYAAIHLAVY